MNHPVWSTYRTHPPLQWAPSPLAELDHWVDLLPEQRRDGEIPRDHRSTARALRPHILEVEHWFLLTGLRGARLLEWDRIVSERRRAQERVRAEECRAVITLSPGSVEHFRQFLEPDVWRKLDHLFPAYPSPPEGHTSNGESFTVLAVANRLSDKGVPETLRAFDALRSRHGARVRMVLVSNRIPRKWRLPEGVEVHETFRMGPKLKAAVYRSADVLVELSYFDSLTCLIEASAFGVPVVSTRIHHGDAFVRDGESGYLVDPPMFAYSEEYGSRWKSYGDFLAELEAMRERGGLDGVVEDVLDRLELMLSGEADLHELRGGARRLHAERFSPEVRNAKLNAIYRRALAR